MDPATQRQQVLFLWLEDSYLEGRVVAWTFHDGTGALTDLPGSPPYRTGSAALRDGWRLLQVSPLTNPPPGHEHAIGHLKHEFVFERIVPLTD
jgi:hypothetical protein